MESNSFSTFNQKEWMEQSPSSGNRSVRESTTSERHKIHLLKKVINNKILTMRLYYMMLSLQKWRQGVAMLRERNAAVLVQKFVKGYIVRKQVAETRQYQLAKVAIYNKVMATFNIVSSLNRRRCIFDVLCAASGWTNRCLWPDGAAKIKKVVLRSCLRRLTEMFGFPRRRFSKKDERQSHDNFPSKGTQKDRFDAKLMKFTKSYKRKMIEFTRTQKRSLLSRSKEKVINDMKHFAQEIGRKRALARIIQIAKRRLVLGVTQQIKDFGEEKKKLALLIKVKRGLVAHQKQPSIRLTIRICKPEGRQGEDSEMRKEQRRLFWPVIVIQRAYKRWKFAKYLASQKANNRINSDLVEIDVASLVPTNSSRCTVV